MSKSAVIHMRVTPELKARALVECQKLSIDLSALVSIALTEYMERRAQPLPIAPQPTT